MTCDQDKADGAVISPRYLGIVKSQFANIATMYSSSFEYCWQVFMRQVCKGPYQSAEIIDTHTNQPVVVMRSIQ